LVQGNPRTRRSAVGSGVVTGVSTATVSASAAVAGAILARKFGRGVETDGFFAAYGVYIALVLVANALRVVVLPRFARARAEGTLGVEVGVWAAALAVPLAPAVVVALAAPDAVAGALTGNAEARDAAASLLPWLVPAAAAQVYAGVAASALAALDDYGTAAAGFALGAVAGLAAIAALVDHGVRAFGWGLALNGAISLAVPLALLAARRGLGRPAGSLWRRLRELAEGVALPFALQGLYVIAYRFASGLGTGRPTTFAYAYLIAALLVAVTASSLALVSSVPLTRAELTPEGTARHVVSASWLSLAVVAPAAGVFALAGERVARWVLGSSYGGGTGEQLGRLVVYLAPWMVASVAVSVTFPLLFVRRRIRLLPLLALAALGLQVLVEWVASSAYGLAGVAAGMAVTTAAVLTALLWQLGSLARSLRGLVVAAVACGGLAAVAFGAPSTVLGAVPAAVVGLALYAVVLASWRPVGLRSAWSYARALR
jgi:O-antigen/teichoic acid export membrane protein